MKERPILFSSAMVRALLAGTKTQTRRAVKVESHQQIEQRDDGRDWPWMYDGERDADYWMACPYGQPGDRLWVREAWRAELTWNTTKPSEIPDEAALWYEADDQPRNNGRGTKFKGKLRSSIHIPRAASRITLEITSVRVERLQNISEADAIAEGVRNSLHLPGGRFARENFENLWWTVNGDGSWESNPWVWVIEFKRVEGGAQ